MQMKKLSSQKDEKCYPATNDDSEENEFRTQTHERPIPVSHLGFIYVVEYVNRESRSGESCAEHSQHQDENRSSHAVVETKYIECGAPTPFRGRGTGNMDTEVNNLPDPDRGGWRA